MSRFHNNLLKLLPFLLKDRVSNALKNPLEGGDSPIIGQDPWSEEDKEYTTSEQIGNHFRSRKFAMTAFAVMVLAFMYFSSILFLFLFQVDFKVTALVQMYRDIIVAVAAIVATLVTSQSIVDWKYHSQSNVETEYSKESSIIESIGNEKEEDYTLDISINSKNG